MESRILVLEDDERRLQWFRQASIGIPLDCTKDVAEAKRLLSEKEYTQIFLDHDLSDDHMMACLRGEPLGKHDEETGYCVARWLAENPEICKNAEIVVHSINPAGSVRMVATLKMGGRNPLWIPFPYLFR